MRVPGGCRCGVQEVLGAEQSPVPAATPPLPLPTAPLRCLLLQPVPARSHAPRVQPEKSGGELEPPEEGRERLSPPVTLPERNAPPGLCTPAACTLPGKDGTSNASKGLPSGARRGGLGGSETSQSGSSFSACDSPFEERWHWREAAANTREGASLGGVPPLGCSSTCLARGSGSRLGAAQGPAQTELVSAPSSSHLAGMR